VQACLQLQVVVIRQGEAGIGQLAAHNGGAPVAPFSRNMISGSRIRRFVTLELEPVTSDGRHPPDPHDIPRSTPNNTAPFIAPTPAPHPRMLPGLHHIAAPPPL